MYRISLILRKTILFTILLNFVLWRCVPLFGAKEQIKKSLQQMVQKDQALRKKINFSQVDELLIQEKNKLNRIHTEKLKLILSKYYWITISEFGEGADKNAWLLVQHADHDIVFQKVILSRLEKLSTLGETSPKHVAYLYDRIAVQEKRPQKYGTQGIINQNAWVVYELENQDDLDQLRAAVGLQPFQEYLQQTKQFYNLGN